MSAVVWDWIYIVKWIKTHFPDEILYRHTKNDYKDQQYGILDGKYIKLTLLWYVC